MRVSLLYPHSTISAHNLFEIGGYEENMRGYPPLTLAYLAAILKKTGHQVHIIDANILRLSFAEVIKEIRKSDPDILGFTVTTATFHNVRAWIKKIKEIVSLPVIIGGALVSIYPHEVMAHPEIDYALQGSGLSALPEFLTVLGNSGDLNSVSGLCFRKDDVLYVNPREDQQDSFLKMPHPARELLPNGRYFSSFSQRKNFTAVVTMKGCPFECTYCSRPDPLQIRDIDDVIEELKECYDRFSVRDVDFYDTVFTLDRQRTIDLCQRIRRNRLSLSWMARTRIHLVDEELLKEMAQSGCRMLMYGIESADPMIQKNLNRPSISIEQMNRKIEMTKKYRIVPFGFFMLGAPGETLHTIRSTLRFAQKSQLDFAQFSKLTIIQATPLYEQYLAKNRFDYWREYIRGNTIRRDPPYVETELGSEKVTECIKKANLSFYLYPRRMVNIIGGVRNIRQIVHYWHAGLSVLKECARGTN
ncbi:MAG: B12-binding domain-containing radical SAM protein [Candidatus Omnitrophica bacterium]|nr:B12-binding domain-containing radical SAM protein [Candidatus Omnitrophota bacterium]